MCKDAECRASLHVQVLKEVLGAIKDIKAQSSAVELQYIDLLDRFATRVSACKPQLKEQYEEQYKQCAQLQEIWNQLEAESVQINAALEDVKLEFSSITCQQVDKFQEHVRTFYNEFKSSGPGRGNIDLGVGVKLMRETEASLCEILKERDALVLAQKLFELDITAYPELSQVLFSALVSTRIFRGKVNSKHCSRACTSMVHRGERRTWCFANPGPPSRADGDRDAEAPAAIFCLRGSC